MIQNIPPGIRTGSPDLGRSESTEELGKIQTPTEKKTSTVFSRARTHSAPEGYLQCGAFSPMKSPHGKYSATPVSPSMRGETPSALLQRHTQTLKDEILNVRSRDSRNIIKEALTEILSLLEEGQIKTFIKNTITLTEKSKTTEELSLLVRNMALIIETLTELIPRLDIDFISRSLDKTPEFSPNKFSSLDQIL